MFYPVDPQLAKYAQEQCESGAARLASSITNEDKIIIYFGPLAITN